MSAGDVGTGTAWRLLAVVVLVLINSFFVAAEFGLVAVRRSRIDQLAAEGDAGARRVQRALAHLDRYISGTQLGITLASLAVGWIGEPALAALVGRGLLALGIRGAAAGAPSPAAESALAVTIAFVLITFFHIVLGELAPKSLAIAHAEGVSRWVTPPLVLFSRVMRPFIWVLNASAAGLLRLARVKPAAEGAQAHSPEELRLLVAESEEHGALDASDSALLSGVLDFRDKRARDVMCPRPDVAAISVDATEADVRALVRREQYSRYPVYRGTLDDVVGIFLVKDLLLGDVPQPFSLPGLLREAVFVPSSRPAERVLDDLHRSNSQMAVVLDEYAGTAGVLTIEDLVEEIVGEIFDEYDAGAGDTVGDDGALQLPGALSLIDARSNHDLHVPEGDWATLGGYVFAAVGRVPALGDRAPFPNGEFEVLVMDGRRVSTVRVHRRRPAPADPATGALAEAADAGDLAGDAAPTSRHTRAAGALPPDVERRAPLVVETLPPHVERRMPLGPARVLAADDQPRVAPTRPATPPGPALRP